MTPAARKGACHHLGPEIDVVPVIGHHGRLARGARGGVDADDVLERLGEQAVRVIVPEVGFFREGQLHDILDAFYVRGLDALLVELLFIKGHPCVDPLADLLQSFALQCGQFLSRQGFFGIPGHGRLLMAIFFLNRNFAQEWAYYKPVCTLL